MLNLKNYNLQSFTIGTKHVRAFSVDNCSGIITDYVLAECGAESSPIPSDHYVRVSSSEGGVKLFNKDDTASLIVTRDNIALTDRTISIEEKLETEEDVLAHCKHITPGILAFINKPKARFLGMVWQFTQKEKTDRQRFKHPIAEELSSNILKFDLKGSEHPSEMGANITFRKKTPTAHLMYDKDDFINVIVNIGEQPINGFWPDTEDERPRLKILEDNKIAFISIDIQVMYDPRRTLTEKDIQAHWKMCQGMKGRIAEILKGVGFESE